MRGDIARLPAQLAPEGFRARRFCWAQVCLGLVFATAVACIAQNGDQTPANQSVGAQKKQNEAADSKALAVNPSVQEKADHDRKKQIADESTQLLSMALALKAEVDKTTKDTLSLNVIRKADEIEKLARTVKEKLK
jgi:hypothetical protein